MKNELEWDFMREIKFRAFDNRVNKYVNIEVLSIFLDEIKDLNSNIIIEQYTGLKDKNGKEIYEGDIIETTGYMVKLFSGAETDIPYIDMHLVCFEENGFALKHKKGDYTYSNYMHFYTDVCEIIGNIHENYKLLEKI